VKDGDIGKRFHSAGQDGIGVTDRDLVGCVANGLRGGGAGPVNGLGGDTREKLREKAHLPSHVGSEHRRDNLPENDLIDLPPVYLAAHEQLPGDVPGQRDGGDIPKQGPAPDERGT
jgi:hypothetical protein